MLSGVSGTHWGPWNASPADKGGVTVIAFEKVSEIAKGK